MNIYCVHTSGHGGETLRVTSYGNGTAYNVEFGSAGSPMWNIFLQGDDALQLNDDFDTLQEVFPDLSDRDIWLKSVDQYI